ncbi:hypothetical protein AgCh_017134 [Apium graveolens]
MKVYWNDVTRRDGYLSLMLQYTGMMLLEEMAFIFFDSLFAYIYCARADVEGVGHVCRGRWGRLEDGESEAASEDNSAGSDDSSVDTVEIMI